MSLTREFQFAAGVRLAFHRSGIHCRPALLMRCRQPARFMRVSVPNMRLGASGLGIGRARACVGLLGGRSVFPEAPPLYTLVCIGHLFFQMGFPPRSPAIDPQPVSTWSGEGISCTYPGAPRHPCRECLDNR